MCIRDSNTNILRQVPGDQLNRDIYTSTIALQPNMLDEYIILY